MFKKFGNFVLTAAAVFAFGNCAGNSPQTANTVNCFGEYICCGEYGGGKFG